MDGIVWKKVPMELWRPQQSGELNLALERGRRHVFLDEDKVSSPLFEAAAGTKPVPGGEVLVHGRPPSARHVDRFSSRWTPPRPWLLSWMPKPRFELVLPTKAPVLFLEEPFEGVDQEAGVRQLLEAHAQRRFTLLLRTSKSDVALAVGETFHVFSEDVGLRGSGDLESVFRPVARARHPAPDRCVNDGDAQHCLVDFEGVRVPLNPSTREQSVSSRRTSFVALFFHACFHVPARHVVLEPTFVHGEPSGSGPLPPVVPLKELSDGLERVGDDPKPGPADAVARWVVLEGTVERQRAVGPWARLELVSSGDQRFQADVRPEEAPAPGSRVRFGFDSAHVVRERFGELGRFVGGRLGHA